MLRQALFILLTLIVLALGCSHAPRQAVTTPPAPIFVPATNQEAVWERVVDVLHQYYFRLAREDRQDGIIETEYKVGAGLQEPWHPDAVGFENRLEGTLQSIRRRVIVRITPDDGGYLVTVEAFKELENLQGLAANSPGGATFQEHSPLQRDLDVVVGQTAPSGWIPLGRDPALEYDMIHRLQVALSQ